MKDDELIIRLTDLMKKEVQKNNNPKGDKASVEFPKEEESFRLSDLAVYKSKSFSKAPPQRDFEKPHETSISEKNENAGPLPDDFEIFSKLKKMGLKPSTTDLPSKDSRTGETEKSERIRVSELVVKDQSDIKFEKSRLFDLSAEEDKPKDTEEMKVAGENKRADEEEPPSAQSGEDHKTLHDPGALYDELTDYLQSVKERITENRSFEIEPAAVIIRSILDHPEYLKDLYTMTLRLTEKESYENIFHQINVMIYSLKMGHGLEYSNEKLVDLGLSSLLHDVGMFRIPEKILQKSGRLTGSELEIIKTHPEIGRDILYPFRGRYPSLPEVALEHHERENGQGYPRGLRGNRPGYAVRENVSPSEAVKIIRAAGGVPVMAHPLSIGNYQVLLPDLIEAGLGGLEAYYGEYNTLARERIAAVAALYGLIATGGQWLSRRRFKEGRGLGSAGVPSSVVEELRSLAGSASDA